MDLGLWEKILTQIVSHTRGRRSLNGISVAGQSAGVPPPRAQIILHGGEPLSLPRRYLEEALRKFEEVTSGEPENYSLCVQTNLLSVPEDKLALLLSHGARLSVSYDRRPGVRLNVAGQPTEKTVAENIDRLLARGVPLGGVAVLAKHTVHHVESVYDFFAERGVPMRILPLFDGPDNRPTDEFLIDHSTILGGLERLFRHWMNTGCQVPLSPLKTHFEATLRHMAGATTNLWSRELRGDAVFLVNDDAKVYRILDAYEPELALGDLNSQTMAEVTASKEYRLSLLRDREDFDNKCRDCEFLGACSGAYIHDARAERSATRCPTAYHCIQFMKKYLEEQGLGHAEVVHLWRQLSGQGDKACA